MLMEEIKICTKLNTALISINHLSNYIFRVYLCLSQACLTYSENLLVYASLTPTLTFFCMFFQIGEMCTKVNETIVRQVSLTHEIKSFDMFFRMYFHHTHRIAHKNLGHVWLTHKNISHWSRLFYISTDFIGACMRTCVYLSRWRRWTNIFKRCVWSTLQWSHPCNSFICLLGARNNSSLMQNSFYKVRRWTSSFLSIGHYDHLSHYHSSS